MKARTTGTFAILAVAVAGAVALVLSRSACREAVYPVERAKRLFTTRVASRLSGMFHGAADNAYSRANEVIGVNAQRIEEYTQFADRDERDIADTKAQLEEIAMQAESLQQKTRLLTESLAATKDALAESEEAFARAQW